MKTLLPLSLAILALSGGMVACSPAENTATKQTQVIVTPPTESIETQGGAEEEKTDDQVQKEIADMSVQTDLHLASQDLDALIKKNPGDNFNAEAQQLLNSRDYNAGTDMTFEARGNDAYTLKGWNEDGWKFTSKEEALVFESETGFKNAWAVPPKR